MRTLLLASLLALLAVGCADDALAVSGSVELSGDAIETGFDFASEINLADDRVSQEVFSGHCVITDDDVNDVESVELAIRRPGSADGLERFALEATAGGDASLEFETDSGAFRTDCDVETLYLDDDCGTYGVAFDCAIDGATSGRGELHFVGCDVVEID